jgi:hypothetical protein
VLQFSPRQTDPSGGGYQSRRTNGSALLGVPSKKVGQAGGIQMIEVQFSEQEGDWDEQDSYDSGTNQPPKSISRRVDGGVFGNLNMSEYPENQSPYLSPLKKSQMNVAKNIHFKDTDKGLRIEKDKIMKILCDKLQN